MKNLEYSYLIYFRENNFLVTISQETRTTSLSTIYFTRNGTDYKYARDSNYKILEKGHVYLNSLYNLVFLRWLEC